MQLKRTIWYEMLATGHTEQWLSIKTGLPLSKVFAITEGRADLTPKIYFKICKAFKQPFNYFVDLTNERLAREARHEYFEREIKGELALCDII